MIPADFDALWFALGIKRKEWTKTTPAPSDTTTRAGGSQC